MATKENVLAAYEDWSGPAVQGYFPEWVNNLADGVILEGSMLKGPVQGKEAVRSIVLAIRSLYERQQHKYAGPCGDRGFLEDYVAQVRGKPIGCVLRPQSLESETDTPPQGQARQRELRH